MLAMIILYYYRTHDVVIMCTIVLNIILGHLATATITSFNYQDIHYNIYEYYSSMVSHTAVCDCFIRVTALLEYLDLACNFRCSLYPTLHPSLQLLFKNLGFKNDQNLYYATVLWLLASTFRNLSRLITTNILISTPQ